MQKKKKRERRTLVVKTPQTTSSHGVLIIPSSSQQVERMTREQTSSTAVNVKVIPNLDIKGTKLHTLHNWRRCKPSQIVEMFRKHYTKLTSLSVMLSRFKKELAGAEDPPPDSFLSKLALSKKEHNETRSHSQSVRRKGALNTTVTSNADDVVLQALQCLTSSDPNLCWSGLLPCTGLRPIEIVKMGKFSTKLNNQQEHGAWWACQTRFAKRGTMKSKFNECRDGPFLAPHWLIERAIAIVRKRWPVKHPSNVEINRKHSTHWQNMLQKAHPMLPGCTAKLFRRFFAAHAHKHFSKGFFIGGRSQASQVGFTSWMLGHAQLEDQVTAHASLLLRPEPRLKLFDVGRKLTTTSRTKKAKGKRSR